jgi:peptidoglycan hydrolase-like protein with peptidoglycan-binding domain
MRANRSVAARDDDDQDTGRMTRALRWTASHPLEAMAAVAAAAASTAILVNALFLQPGRHPAPIFGTFAPPPEATGAAVLPRPRPDPDAVVPRTRTEVVTGIQRELARRGFYDGTVDGIYGSKTDAAVRDFEQQSGLKLGAEPAESVLRTILQAPLPQPKPKPATAAPAAAPVASPATAARPAGKRPDPLGDLIAPPAKRVLAVQRALADFGYGPVKPTGVFGPETERAIEKFERERKMPVTGHISDRLMRELAGMTGRPLD